MAQIPSTKNNIRYIQYLDWVIHMKISTNSFLQHVFSKSITRIKKKDKLSINYYGLLQFCQASINNVYIGNAEKVCLSFLLKEQASFLGFKDILKKLDLDDDNTIIIDRAYNFVYTMLTVTNSHLIETMSFGFESGFFDEGDNPITNTLELKNLIVEFNEYLEEVITKYCKKNKNHNDADMETIYGNVLNNSDWDSIGILFKFVNNLSITAFIIDDEKIMNEIHEKFMSNLLNNFSQSLFLDIFFKEFFLQAIKIKAAFLGANQNNDETLKMALINLLGNLGHYSCSYHLQILSILINDIRTDSKNLNLLNEQDLLDLDSLQETFKKMKDIFDKSKLINGLSNLAEKLGLETESMNDKCEKLFILSKLETVEILKIEKHPSSDKLNLCTISGDRVIVCGAQNVHKIMENNLTSVYAPLGTLLINGMLIKPREIRGVISNGMLCAPEELGCNPFDRKLIDYDGIIQIDKSDNDDLFTHAINIRNLENYFNFQSTIDLSVTPNLGSLLGEENLFMEMSRFLIKGHKDIAKMYDSTQMSEFKKIKELTLNESSTKDAITDASEIIVENDVRKYFKTIISIKIDRNKIKITNDIKCHLLSCGYDLDESCDLINYVNYIHLKFGIYFHIISGHKEGSGGLIIKKLLKNDHFKPTPAEGDYVENKIVHAKLGDIAMVDKDGHIICIPGVVTNKQFSHTEHIVQKVQLIGFSFAWGAKILNKGYEKFLIFARQNHIKNKLVYFYERGGTLNTDLFANYFNGPEGSSMTNITFINIDNFANINTGEQKSIAKELESINEKYKIIRLRFYDFLILFKKDSLLLFNLMRQSAASLHRMNETLDDKMINFFEDDLDFDASPKSVESLESVQKEAGQMIDFYSEYFIKDILPRLNCILSKHIERVKFGMNEFYVNVPVWRSDINSSMDLVAILFKILNYDERVSVTNDQIRGYFAKYHSFVDDNIPKHLYFENMEIYRDSLIDDCYEESTLPNESKLDSGDYNSDLQFYQMINQLSSIGYKELYNYTFIDPRIIEKISLNNNSLSEKYGLLLQSCIKLDSPINQNLSIMRPSLLFGLLDAIGQIRKLNNDGPIKLLESGPIFASNNIFNDLICGVLTGNKFKRNIYGGTNNNNNFFDFFDAKADFLIALKKYNIDEDMLKFELLEDTSQSLLPQGNQDKLLLHTLRSAAVFLKDSGILIGCLGEISPLLLNEYDFFDLKDSSTNVSTFMIYKNNLKNLLIESKKLFTSEYQSSKRDLSLIFDENVKIADVHSIISKNDLLDSEKIVQNISFFDIFQNDKLKQDKQKSIGFSVKLQSARKTLNDKDIHLVMNNIINAIDKELGGKFPEGVKFL